MSIYDGLFKKYPFLEKWVASRKGIHQLEKTNERARFEHFLANQVLRIEEKPWQNLSLWVRPEGTNKVVENQRIIEQSVYTIFWHTPEDLTQHHTHYSGEPENRWSVGEIMTSMIELPHIGIKIIIIDAVVLTTHTFIIGTVTSNKYRFDVYQCPAKWTSVDVHLFHTMETQNTLLHGPTET